MKVRSEYDRQNCANQIALIASWMAGFDIEWATEGVDDDWSVCPMSPDLWDFQNFQYRLKVPQ